MRNRQAIDPSGETLHFGAELGQARGAVILLHGRGSSPLDMIGLAERLPLAGLAFLAPGAKGGTWYPNRFLAPLDRNEPWLSSALQVIAGLVAEIEGAGKPIERIGLVGFSQGACLALEYVARHPRRYGFAASLSGALIGPLDTPRAKGDLRGTPVLLGCAESDAHIPIEYVEKSSAVLSALGGAVTKQIFPGEAHTVFPAEIAWLKERLSELGG